MWNTAKETKEFLVPMEKKSTLPIFVSFSMNDVSD